MENYQPLEINIVLFQQQDIVTASLPNDDTQADIFA